MKQLLFLIIAVAFFTTGCNEVESPAMDDQSFSFHVVADPGVGSRANGYLFGEGERVNSLRYALYTTDGVLIDCSDTSAKSVVTDDGFLRWTVSFSGVKEGSYKIFFWADAFGENGYGYDIDFNSATLTVDYEKTMYRDGDISDHYDAFMNVTPFTTSSIPSSVTLTRPLCQVNIGTNEDWIKKQRGDEFFYKVAVSTGKRADAQSQFPNKLNILTGEIVKGAVQRVSIGQSAQNWAYCDRDFPLYPDCKYVFMGYVLCPGTISDWVYDAKVNDLYLYRFKTSIPSMTKIPTYWGIGDFWNGPAENARLIIVPGCVTGESSNGLFDCDDTLYGSANFIVSTAIGFNNNWLCWFNSNDVFGNVEH